METNILIRAADALDLLGSLPNQSVHLLLTDPPYFIDGMGDDWSAAKLTERTSKAGVIGGLPVGMRFDPAQGRRFEKLMRRVADEAMRVLVPGAFAIAFSQARLYHRLGVSFDDAGFEIRDMLGWTYSGQAKAFSQDHFVRRMARLTAAECARIIKRLGGRKTPQLRPCIEPMVLAQKPKAGTFVDNWLAHETGLVDVTQTLEPGKFPGNLMPCPKPDGDEKGGDHDHLTPKPLRLIEHLIRLFTIEGQVVCDPFLGSGTTALACKRADRAFVGGDINPDYVALSQARLAKELL